MKNKSESAHISLDKGLEFKLIDAIPGVGSSTFYNRNENWLADYRQIGHTSPKNKNVNAICAAFTCYHTLAAGAILFYCAKSFLDFIGYISK